MPTTKAQQFKNFKYICDMILDMMLILFSVVVLLLCAAAILYVAWLAFWVVAGIVGAVYFGVVKKKRLPTQRRLREMSY